MIIKLILKFLGILFILLGILFIINPEVIYVWLEDNMKTSSLYIFAILFRLSLGILLIVAAKDSKYSGPIKFFGYLAIIAALVLILIGQESFQGLIALLITDFRPYAHVSGLFSMGAGGFLIYAFSRRINSQSHN